MITYKPRKLGQRDLVKSSVGLGMQDRQVCVLRCYQSFLSYWL